MTKDEKLGILADAEARCYEALKAAIPGSEGMRSLLRDLFDISLLHVEEEDESADLPGQFDSPAPKQDLDPEPAPEPDPNAMSFAEVKKKMIQYQTAHNLDIAALMQSMGYQKLSDIPESKYNKLIELAEAKIKEKA